MSIRRVTRSRSSKPPSCTSAASSTTKSAPSPALPSESPSSKPELAPLSITVTLPWPSHKLTPNFKRRNHWSKYRKTAKAYRATCFALTRETLGRRIMALLDGVEINFFPPDLRARDDDGMIGQFKAGRDGVADAIGIDDKHWHPIYHFHPPHRPDGKIIVTLNGGSRHE